MSLLKHILTEVNSRIKEFPIDPEDAENETYIDEAYELAKNTGITILSGMDIHYVKVDTESDTVIGALFISNDSQSFSFDVVVDRSYENVGHGSDLVKVALEEYDYLKDVYGEDFPIAVHVVNPKMESMLKNKFDFVEVRKLSQRETVLTLKE